MRRALLFALVAALAAVAHGLDISVETDFTSDHAAAEASARLKVCSALGDAEKKIECVKHLIDPTAACVASGATSTCTVNGVTLTLADVTFSCEGGEYNGNVVASPTCLADVSGFEEYLTGDGGLPTCPAADSVSSTNGGYNGACSISARCHYINDGAATEFGDYCPASGGTTCCGEGITIAPGAFPANTPTTTFSNLTRLEIDHVVDLDIDITYELQAPADLKISVEVPYVTSTSVVNHNGVNYKLCPSAYLVDFTDPVETIPPLGSWVGTKRGGSTPFGPDWMPLTHMPMYDLVGDARSICAAQSFSFDPAATGTLAFDYPETADATTSVNYNSILGANDTVWTDEFDVPTTTMWRGDIKAGNTRFTWNTTDYFDIVRAYSKCQKRVDGTRLVTPTVEPELSYINGVGYNVTTYSWTMHVCQVGYFGQHCNSHPPSGVSTYAKACKTAPASFSITPQQVSTAVVTPVDSNLYTKTFLQSVRSSTDTCSVNHERYVIVLSLIIYSEQYTIVTDTVSDLLYPTNVFADPATQTDFSVDNSASVTSVAEFMGKLDGADIDGEGVYVLNEVVLSIGTQEIKSQKVVIVTKCYNTGYDSTTGVRTTPNAFSEAHKTVANGDSTVFLDLEMLVERTDADLAGVKQTNTLNLRVLASAETFDLPSKESLAQLDMSATHLIYGDVQAASLDTDQTASFARTGDSIDSTRRPGDQICSKQQLDDAFAPTANLEPNAVGACILTDKGAGNPNKGKTIKYSVNGVLQPPLTFGCFQNWIDTDAATFENGVYNFPTYPTPLTETHEGIYWIAKLGDLSEDVIDLGGTNTTTVKDLFGAGLFYHDSTTDTPANQFSDEMQHPPALQGSLSGMGAGCKNTIGYMKSACNLVCFDLRRNLLSDKAGKKDRDVIVHHISVATIVNEAQSDVVFRRHHRRLLESVSLSAPASEGSQTSSATSTSILTVVPDRMATPPPPAVVVGNASNVNATSSKDNDDNFDGGMIAAIIVMLTLVILLIGGLAYYMNDESSKAKPYIYMPYGKKS